MNRPRGRPRLGNVLFARRVNPSIVPALLGLISGDVAGTGNKLGPGPVVDKPDPMPVPTKAEGNILALLDNVDVLTKEVEGLKAKLDRCARATDDEKGRRWLGLYDQLLAKVRAKYPDEGW